MWPSESRVTELCYRAGEPKFSEDNTVEVYGAPSGLVEESMLERVSEAFVEIGALCASIFGVYLAVPSAVTALETSISVAGMSGAVAPHAMKPWIRERCQRWQMP
jgi:hypothetical protein